MEEKDAESSKNEHKIRDLFEKINPFWGLLGICVTFGGFCFWIGNLTTKYDYLQIINEKNIEHQKDIQELRDELLKCQLDVKILESKSDEKDAKRRK